jgi:HK97 family phage prohead protease
MSSKASRATVTGTERRNYPVQLEVRAQSKSKATVEGYASVVERGYEMWDSLGSYTETIRSGAFTKTLSERPSVQLLLNHGGLSMAYTRAGTLRLAEDSTGLHMAADVNTSRSDVRDMMLALEDGAVDEMSFAFRVPQGKNQWNDDYSERDILEVDMHRGDVSVVNFGANPNTSIGMRGQDLDQMDETAARELYERLGRRLAPPKPQRSIALLKALAESQG